MDSRLLPFAVRNLPTPASSDSQWLLGPSPAAAQLWQQIRRVAPHYRTALLLGEPGCGAEHAARVLHDLSPDKGLPFLMLSAADAEERFRGRSLYADEGVIFLPELERLSRPAQNSLLQMVRRRGNRSARVIAASSRSLRTLVAASGFNPELANALGAIHIALPALRNRAEDITPLAECALQMSAAAHNLTAPKLSPSVLEAAHTFSWPGNLDQLRAAFEWLMEVHGTEETLYARDLESAIAAVAQTAMAKAGATPNAEPRMLRLDLIVQEHVSSVLTACQGNKLRAAEVLGISRSTLYRMLDQIVPAAEADTEFAIAV
jgi:DNA-binding NtrC family response regulator